MVETLERRGMLSATIGSLADQAVDDVTPAEENVPSVESLSGAGEGPTGLPEGVSLMICPLVDWADGDRALLASNAFDDGVTAASLLDPSSDVLNGFPLELAPLVPEKPEFWGWSDSDSIVDPVSPDAPAMNEGGQFTPEYEYHAWAFSAYSVDEITAESGGVTDSASYTSFDGQAGQRGFTLQHADHGAPRLATGASTSHSIGDSAAAAIWMNVSAHHRHGPRGADGGDPRAF